jgi:hypothetical protein
MAVPAVEYISVRKQVKVSAAGWAFPQCFRCVAFDFVAELWCGIGRVIIDSITENDNRIWRRAIPPVGPRASFTQGDNSLKKGCPRKHNVPRSQRASRGWRRVSCCT